MASKMKLLSGIGTMASKMKLLSGIGGVSKVVRRGSSEPPFRNVSTLIGRKRNGNVEEKEEGSKLYKRISSVGHPNESVVPVLDNWIQEGRSVDLRQLRSIVKELRHYNHFNHALQVSQWMTNKRYMPLTPSDLAIRLDLIGKVYGIEEAENLFNTTAKKLKTVEVYGALLSCYAHKKCVDKAETILKQMRELGFGLTTLNYNLLLSLYFQTAKQDKAETLMQEMEAQRVKFDRFTYSILLNRYGADSNIDSLEKVISKIESDPEIDVDWNIYATAALQYIRAGLVDKGLVFLKKSEKLVSFANRKNEAFTFILTLYATAGRKEDMLRMWKKCKLYPGSNVAYKKMMSSILKFDDLETAEKIFEEWGCSDRLKDIRIPNYLIESYCKKGLMEKAEALLEKINKKQWQKPTLFTWSCMLRGYYGRNQMPEAVEALSCAVSLCRAKGKWKPDKEILVACLKHLKDGGDIERSGELIRLLKDKDIISLENHDRLVEYVSGEYGSEDVFKGIELGVYGENLAEQVIKDCDADEVN